MEKIIIKATSTKKILWVFLCLIMAASSGILIFTDMFGSIYIESVAVFVGILGALFFGGILILYIYWLFKRDKVLVIDAEGFYDYSTLMSPCSLVAWSDVEEIKIRTVSHFSSTQQFIGVQIKDTNKLLSRLPKYKRLLIRMNLKFGYPPIAINLSSTNGNCIDAIKIMHQYHQSANQKG